MRGYRKAAIGEGAGGRRASMSGIGAQVQEGYVGTMDLGKRRGMEVFIL